MDQPDDNLPVTRAEFKQYLEARREQDEYRERLAWYAVDMATYAALRSGNKKGPKKPTFPNNEQEQQHGK